IHDFPKTQQANQAKSNLRNLYVTEGNPQGYFDYLNSIGQKVKFSVKDSLSYSAAESSFARENYDVAIHRFTKYLSKYPHGHFNFKAHFYRGEIVYKLKKYEYGLNDYRYIIDHCSSLFMEHSAKIAASINFYKKKDYEKALIDYRAL